MAREVMLPQIFKDMPFTKVQSYSQSVDQICIVLGPVFAAALFNLFGWEIVVVVSAAVFCCADALISIWRRLSGVELKQTSQRKEHWTKPFRIAFNHLFFLAGLKRIVALSALANLVFGVTVQRRPVWSLAYMSSRGILCISAICRCHCHFHGFARHRGQPPEADPHRHHFLQRAGHWRCDYQLYNQLLDLLAGLLHDLRF